MRLDYMACKRLASVCRAGSAHAGRVAAYDHIKFTRTYVEAISRHMVLRVPTPDADVRPYLDSLNEPYALYVHGSALKLVSLRQYLVLNESTRRLTVHSARKEDLNDPLIDVPDKAVPELEWPDTDAIYRRAAAGADPVSFGFTGKALKALSKLLPTRREEHESVVLTVRAKTDAQQGLIEVTAPGIQAVVAPILL